MNQAPVGRAIAIDVGGITLSGRAVEGTGARGLIVALHGGGYDWRYWHADDRHDGSLLNLAARLGFDVIAPDRPGYGLSGDVRPQGFSLAEQVDLVFALIDRCAAGRPVHLIGHSMGGILALMMAADPRSAGVTAVDVSGVPLRYPAAMRAQVDALAAATDAVAHRRHGPGIAQLRQMFYSDDGTFDPRLADLVDGRHVAPLAEVRDAARAPDFLPPLMRRIRTPVQWTVASDERSSVGGEAMLAYVRDTMPSAARLATHLQAGSGHNISIHHVAAAYHLRAIAFFIECAAMAGASA